MGQNIIIKSNRHGLSLYLSEEPSFAELLDELRKKFAETKKFFGAAEMALSIEGRALTSDEINKIVNIISTETELTIISIFDNVEANDIRFQKKLNSILEELDANACEIYPKSLSEGQNIYFKHSVVILGDLDIDCEVHTNGSVFILGKCLGKVYAGELGNKSAKVFANVMNPREINIADVSFGLSVFKGEKKKKGLFVKNSQEEYTSYFLYLDDEGECVYKHTV